LKLASGALPSPSLLERGRGPPRNGGRVRGFTLSGFTQCPQSLVILGLVPRTPVSTAKKDDPWSGEVAVPHADGRWAERGVLGTSPRMTVERWSEAAGSVLGVQRTNPGDFNALNFLDPIWSSPSRPPVSLTHLVAGKGRKASDHCGGGGRSSGGRREGVTRAVRGLPSLGSPPAVGVERGQSACIAHWPAPSAAGPVGNDWDRVRLSLNRAAHRMLADNDGAERLASSKRYLSQTLRTSSGAPRPFPFPQRFPA
jgi:hypothetical protein